MDHYQIVCTEYLEVLHHLELSIHAEQAFCSTLTQMEYLPRFKDQPALRKVHKENYATSYHRNTAAGNLTRLIDGDVDELLVLMTVECFIETRQHDKTAEFALAQISVTNLDDEEWMNAANEWHFQRKRQLRYAAKALRSVIAPELWNKGATLAER